jgi:hypothetical protein
MARCEEISGCALTPTLSLGQALKVERSLPAEGEGDAALLIGVVAATTDGAHVRACIAADLQLLRMLRSRPVGGRAKRAALIAT